jgi:hypothetical protein
VANGVGRGTYADVIGDPKTRPAARFVQDIPGPLLFNAAASPRGLTFGNSGRNFLRNPQRTNFDMALFKHFSVSESKNFEFRAEAFNIFNHTQCAGINNGAVCYVGGSSGDAGCISTTSFLHPFIAHRSRILRLGFKFIF